METPDNNRPAEGADRVTKFWAEIPSNEGVTAALWRIPEKGQPEFLDTYFLTLDAYPDEYAFYDEVKAEHGGGKYELRVTTPGGQWVKRPAFCIGGKPKRQTDEAERAPQGQSELAMILQRSDERFAQVMAELKEMRKTTAAPVDPLQQITQLSGVIRDLTQGQTQPKEKSLIEQVVEKKFLDFLSAETGGGESGFGWVPGVVEGVLGSLAMAKGQAGGEAGAGDEGEGAPPAESDKPVTQADMVKKLRSLIATMVQLAEVDAVPAKAAEKIKALAGAHWPNLCNVIRNPQAVDLAAQMVPEVTKHRAWFEQLRAAVLKPAQPAQGGEGGGTAKQPRAAGGKKAAASAAVEGRKRPARHAANA